MVAGLTPLACETALLPGVAVPALGIFIGTNTTFLIAISTFGISIASSKTFGDFIGITKAASKPPVVASPRSWQARG